MLSSVRDTCKMPAQRQLCSIQQRNAWQDSQSCTNKPQILLVITLLLQNITALNWHNKYIKDLLNIFTQRNLSQTLFNWNWILFLKTQRSLFEPLFRGLRGKACIPSIARWKARGRLPICHNWIFSTICYGWDVTSGNLSKSALLEEGGSNERIFQTEAGVTHQPLLVSEN